MPHTIEDFLEIRAAAVRGTSPDGSHVLYASNVPGHAQLYRVPRTGGEPLRVTDTEEAVTGRYLPTTEEVLVVHDVGGNERTQISLVDADGGALRPLVHDPEHLHTPGGITRNGRFLAYATNRRNGVDFDVWVRDLQAGEERCVWDRGGWCSAGEFSPDGSLLAVSRLTERSGDNELYLVDVATGDVVEVAPHPDEAASVTGPSWLPDGSGFYFATDVGADVRSVCRYEVATGTWEPVLSYGWDATCTMDEAGRTLFVSVQEEGYVRHELRDPDTLEERGVLPTPGPGCGGGLAPSRDGRHIAFTHISPTEPGDVWTCELGTGELRRLTESPCGVPRDVFVEPELHRYTSFDGESIPVFLFRPTASDAPVVVHIHGGPESQYVPSFNPVTQYLVHRGFAVVAPNVRGSTGYGKRFQHLDDGRQRLDAVRDLESLHRWLGEVDGVDADRAALMGGSYGGYMVLAGLAFQPELWAAGVDIVGISSLVTFLENTSSYRRRYREREYGSLEHDRDFLEEASPLTHVDRIAAPLFVIHGENDPRVPVGEARQIHRSLTERGVPCELVVYPDEGHGLAKLRNRLDAYPRVADFLERHLGAGS